MAPSRNLHANENILTSYADMECTVRRISCLIRCSVRYAVLTPR